MTLAEITKAAQGKTTKQKAELLTQYTGNKSWDEILRVFDVPRKLLDKALAKKAKNDEDERIKKIQINVGGGVSAQTIRKLEKLAQDILFDTQHSMGYDVRININKKIVAEYDARQSYAGNRYRARHGYHNFGLTKVEARNIEKIEGVWTVRLKNGKAKWIVGTGRKQFHKVFWQEGYLVGTSHGNTKAEAVDLERKKQIKAIEIAKRNVKFFGIEHLRNIGACNAGIEAAAKEMGIDISTIGGIRVDYAMELGKKAHIESRVANYVNRIQF